MILPQLVLCSYTAERASPWWVACRGDVPQPSPVRHPPGACTRQPRLRSPPVTPRGPRRRSSDTRPAAGDEVVVVPWPLLFRQRVAARVEGSERYRWWVLWTVLAGLFSVNVTFTVFAVALPRISRELGTTEEHADRGHHRADAGLRRGRARARSRRRCVGHRRVYLLGMGGAVIGAACSAAGVERRFADPRFAPSTRLRVQPPARHRRDRARQQQGAGGVEPHLA